MAGLKGKGLSQGEGVDLTLMLDHIGFPVVAQCILHLGLGETFGELTLDKIYLSGPCRRGSNIFISAYSYGGEFYLSYRYASRFVQLDETFLDLWREL